jgi:hypothetical protein
MNDIDQIRAIAEDQGWEYHKTHSHLVTAPNMPNSVQYVSTVPDYCNDLNAMREVELAMDSDHYQEYAEWLWRLVDEGEIAYPNDLIVAMASAAHRAEAYLRTIDKWVGE